VEAKPRKSHNRDANNTVQTVVTEAQMRSRVTTPNKETNAKMTTDTMLKTPANVAITCVVPQTSITNRMAATMAMPLACSMVSFLGNSILFQVSNYQAIGYILYLKELASHRA
jgi:hypothetical protein